MLPPCKIISSPRSPLEKCRCLLSEPLEEEAGPVNRPSVSLRFGVYSSYLNGKFQQPLPGLQSNGLVSEMLGGSC